MLEEGILPNGKSVLGKRFVNNSLIVFHKKNNGKSVLGERFVNNFLRVFHKKEKVKSLVIMAVMTSLHEAIKTKKER